MNILTGQLCIKLVKANAMLSKICYFVNEIPFIIQPRDNPLFHLTKFALYREIIYV